MMEKAQLFKRLLAITYDDLALFINFDEQVSVGLMKLDLAAGVDVQISLDDKK